MCYRVGVVSNCNFALGALYCRTCHTNYAYLYARPLITSNAPAHAAVRQFAEELVEKRWVEKGPRWDAEVVASAAALAFNDAATTRKLHPLTKTALERMWTGASDPAISRGVVWLKTHQRSSGRWITRSLKEDSKHFISHCGTAFAVMAIASCEPSAAIEATGRVDRQ